MKVVFFNSKEYDRKYFNSANIDGHHEFVFLEPKLSLDTVCLTQGAKVICVFVNDNVDAEIISRLAINGVKLIALRCAGFNNVDLNAASEHGIRIVRVPAYSPNAVAEYTVGLMLALNRKIHRAYCRVREGNFALNGLLGFDMAGKTAGVIGTGQIGALVVRTLCALDMNVLMSDPIINEGCVELGARYVDINTLFAESDIISLHCPLTPETHHIIDAAAIDKMKQGVMLINTSRGAVVDTTAVIASLKTGQIGMLGLDVYEQEEDLFFEDHSYEVITDDVFERLLTFPNALITAHQGFFTADALSNIAATTLDNILQFENDSLLDNEVSIR
ncbi:MAG: 2-hydroxyacid dehydrogenase [Sulfuriflexus sp.]|nr:2-hydroxyacid dehydrogenase [Sulfuriflexus sp.]